MKTFKTSVYSIITLSILSALIVTGCNTIKGIGKDTERVGEKIQEKASK